MQNRFDCNSLPTSGIADAVKKRLVGKTFTLKKNPNSQYGVLADHLSQLEDYTHALSHGDLDARIPIGGLKVTHNIAALQSQLLLTTQLLCRAVNGDYSGRMSSGMLFHAPINTLLERLDRLEHTQNQVSAMPEDTSTMLMVLENTEVIIVVVDELTRQVRFMNHYARASLGLQADTPDSLLTSKHPLIQLLVSYRAQADGKQASRWEAYCSNPMRWYNVSTNLIQAEPGHMVYIHSAIDITEQKRNARKLENFAYLDPLTSLPNRREGYAQLEYEINSQRNDVLSVCFIDVDNLKVINDLYGHEEGDQALILLTSAIRNSIRPRDHASRFAGDEFIIVFPRCDQQRADAVIERIRADALRAAQAAQKPYPVTFSYGIAQWTPQSGLNAKMLLEMADNHMYSAKKKTKTEPS